jgi:hypothetical protein
MDDSLGILNVSFQYFTVRHLVKKGDVLGYYSLPWGGDAQAVAASNIDVLGWKGSDIQAQVVMQPVTDGDKSGQTVGDVKAANQTTKVLLSADIVSPSQSWRLLRWF